MTQIEKTRPDHRLHWRRLDSILLACLTLAYALLALLNLGSHKAPQSFWVQTQVGESVTLDLGERFDRFAMLYYCGVSHNGFTVQVSPDGSSWSEPYAAQMAQGRCYQWHYLTTPGGSDTGFSGVQALSGRYVRITAGSMTVAPSEGGGTTHLRLGEVIFRELVDAEGSQWPVSGQELLSSLTDHTGGDPADALYSDGRQVNDEPGTCEGEPSWFNSTYFDEIYHARTAYEVLHGESVYEWTHPPLGKLIMSLGVAIFGMTPFGWRVMGALAGVAMVPALYLLAKQLTKKTWPAFLGAALMSLDLMHFTQTRIATIDSYPVLFIILSFFFMLRFMQRDLGAEGMSALWRSLPDLGLCGLCFGLGVASKWIGLYAGAGLALLFFWKLIAGMHRAYEGAPEQRASLWRAFAVGLIPALLVGIVGAELLKSRMESLFMSIAVSAVAAVAVHGLGMVLYTRITLGDTGEWRRGGLRWTLLCLFCVLFFILIPVLIYALSFIPRLSVFGAEGPGDWIRALLNEQTRMFNYHAQPGFGMDHPFYSPWYEWPLIARPMYYESVHYAEPGYSYAIFCFGNPAVWWSGCAAVILMWGLWAWVRARDRRQLRLGEAVPAEGLPLMTGPAFIMIAFAAQFLPWVLVPRGTYIYHFFASVPFLILALVYCVHLLSRLSDEVALGLSVGLAVLAVLYFAILFPYASGIWTPGWYLDIGSRLLHLYHG